MLVAAAAPVVHVGPSWTQLVVVALIGVVGLFIAALIGARLGARWTKEQTLELHRVQREQDALLRLLDLLSVIDMEVLRSSPGDPDERLSWSDAVECVGAPMIREYPGRTWDRSDMPDKEFYQWGRIARAVLDAESEDRQRQLSATKSGVSPSGVMVAFTSRDADQRVGRSSVPRDRPTDGPMESPIRRPVRLAPERSYRSPSPRRRIVLGAARAIVGPSTSNGVFA